MTADIHKFPLNMKSQILILMPSYVNTVYTNFKQVIEH